MLLQKRRVEACRAVATLIVHAPDTGMALESSAHMYIYICFNTAKPLFAHLKRFDTNFSIDENIHGILKYMI